MRAHKLAASYVEEHISTASRSRYHNFCFRVRRYGNGTTNFELCSSHRKKFCIQFTYVNTTAEATAIITPRLLSDDFWLYMNVDQFLIVIAKKFIEKIQV